jgi:16S rRNA (cytidine1402-2'-O)-methyltransferase
MGYNSVMSTLYIVATPIGNLEDITFRAIRILQEVKLVAVEDTRRTKLLLATYGINTPMTSYHEHNKVSKLEFIMAHLEREDIALVSEAGMPGISDPGYELVVAAIEEGIQVVPVPGPSVVITALAISGLPTDRFSYIGFLPRRKNARRHLLESIAGESSTIVALETPHRLAAALDDILVVLGDRKTAICRELTKMHEEVFRGTVEQAIRYFTEPRGEFTLVIEGKEDRGKPQLNAETEKRLRDMHRDGVTAREAVAMVANETSFSKRELYRAWLKIC